MLCFLLSRIYICLPTCVSSFLPSYLLAFLPPTPGSPSWPQAQFRGFGGWTQSFKHTISILPTMASLKLLFLYNRYRIFGNKFLVVFLSHIRLSQLNSHINVENPTSELFRRFLDSFMWLHLMLYLWILVSKMRMNMLIKY